MVPAFTLRVYTDTLRTHIAGVMVDFILVLHRVEEGLHDLEAVQFVVVILIMQYALTSIIHRSEGVKNRTIVNTPAFS